MRAERKRLIGRTTQIQAAAARLADDGVVNLFGPPGVGKSGLAAVLADHALDQLGVERMAAVDARQLESHDSLRRELAGSLSIAWDGRDPDVLFRSMGRQGRTLLLIEDVDPLAETMAEELRHWFAACPGLSIITTSMRRLGTPFDFELTPLEAGDARELFVRRVRETRPDYAPDDAELAALDELLRALDQLPLAIELAASRRGVLSPRDILERLENRFELLRERRGRALAGAVEWAWDQLGPELQELAASLAVFEGPFELDAAQAIAVSDAVIDGIEDLCDHSIVRAAPNASVSGESRFEMYQTIREFIRGRAGDLPLAAHAAYFLSRGSQWADDLDRGDSTALNRLVAALPELRTVFARSQRTAPDRSAAVALLLDRVFARTGTDAVREHALDLALEAGPPPAACAALLHARALTRVGAGNLEGAREDLSDAISAARAAGDRELEAAALFRSGDVARRCGEVGDALMLLAQATDLTAEPELERQIRAHLACCHVDCGKLERAREDVAEIERLKPATSAVVECEVRRRLAYVHFYLGNFAEQHRQGQAALEAANHANHRRLQGLCEQGLADSAVYLGRLDDAQTSYERGLEIHRQLGDLHYEGVLLGNLGTVHHRSDRLDDAARCYREALAIHRQTGALPYEAVVAMSLGMLEVERGRLEEAEHHLIASIAASGQLGVFDDVGAAQLARGWAAIRRGDSNTAIAHFAAARTAFEQSDAAAWSAIADFLAGGTRPADVELAVDKHGGPTEQGLLVQANRWRRVAGKDFEERETASLHVRLARSVMDAVETGLPHVPARSLEHVSETLRLSVDGKWFEFAGDRVDLRRRKATRLILLELTKRHAAGSDALGVYDAFDVGWPDEHASAEAAADRVYWVVGTLRRLGLRDALITEDDGYLLAPAVRIELVD